ncbi:ribonuclease P/MRP protein subunit POP5-like isoform X1 [Dreissena polymorpha]|uniref:ribonuclease P/MRP protein subunit POP5-like isoform X1 n=1 Tax=Dreissena polymorpha TaxID=45954 RepID=UPI002264B599|nr:ribonuclease P/MRP protein subunit POP5-like isoform X1 [Dreissena polymorpha]
MPLQDHDAHVISRYIVCKLEFGCRVTLPDLTQDAVYRAIATELQVLHGDYGTACARKYPNLTVQYLNPSTNLVMVRCSRDQCKQIQSCLPFVKKIGEVDVFLHTLHLAGTIRSCMKFIVRYHKSQLPLLMSECRNPVERKKVQEMLTDSCADSGRTLGLLERSTTSQ